MNVYLQGLIHDSWVIYSAGKLESKNIVEYEVAARLAHLAELYKYENELISFAELEWDHELYFRSKAQSHFLYSFFPKWTIPKKRSLIAKDMDAFKKDQV